MMESEMQGGSEAEKVLFLREARAWMGVGRYVWFMVGEGTLVEARKVGEVGRMSEG